jgi:zinc D-Ala-D-Ala dipeptidase
LWFNLIQSHFSAWHGFRPYEREWWRFTLRGELFPDTYFDFPVR